MGIFNVKRRPDLVGLTLDRETVELLINCADLGSEMKELLDGTLDAFIQVENEVRESDPSYNWLDTTVRDIGITTLSCERPGLFRVPLV